ncbi:glucose 1-dehydrogenase [Bradyrhizobium daqingense]|uniref:NAD(P)-dependent dehydrogenase (Short-subunit alcohol dehydrogenase family) n=1 Tax=Bradyrhizobium daqingense TaxID=993502 RepID=A0A562LD78_9BRAD|nr:glucose 1-dehydrogenase [Bradyrhizobium daqingense]TWI05590.1 NAD(P)-dependent dehydrogenase (short-subunit alcohol dehydrogenase family) [Bradyrhizobium daqingense]UFS91336.1 glucose 1-dehydrogenase [Bradyrhizobium daqingense]
MSGASPASQRMRGNVCLVTGGGSGIGRATALRMASEGAEAILVAGRRAAEIEATAAGCRDLGAVAIALQTDITREDDVARLVGTAIARCGRLDVAFNNAGFQERRAPLEEQGTDIYDSVFDTNVRALFLCLRHQLPVMLAQGRGSIVVNASVSGVRNPNPGFSLYSASKAAAISLTRSAAMENAPRGIRINAIAPGRVVTDMMLRAGVGDVATVSAGLPLRRMGSPEEVAEAVVWLASDVSSYVVGHVLAADGGFLAS